MTTRRNILKAGTVGALGLAALSTVIRKPPTSPEAPLTVGFLYVGAKEDFGYNQSHATTAARLGQIRGITLVEQAHVPETEEVVTVMQRMLDDHQVDVLFPTSYGYYDPYVLKFARTHPTIPLLHAGGLVLPGHPANISSYFGYIDEGMYLAGIIAGYSSPNGRYGFVAAMDIPHARRNINAFMLGVRTVNPSATMNVRFTGSWFDPAAERLHSEELIADGAEVIACHVDSPAVILETCVKRDRYCIGYHSDLSALAPNHMLTGVQWDWWPVVFNYIQSIWAHQPIPSMIRQGLRESMIVLSPIGPMVTVDARKHVTRELDEFLDQSRSVYTGPIMDNEGNLVLPEGVRRERDDPWLETMDWFLEGVEV